MKLLDLLRRESSISLRRLGLMAGVAGLSNAMVLAIINQAASHAVNDEHYFSHFLMFAVAVAIYVIAQRYIMVISTAEVEAVLHRIRVRMADKVRRADLLPLERIGRSQIYASISRETQTISQASAALVIAVQAAVLIFFTVLYVAWLSLVAFLLCGAFVAVGLSVYFRRGREMQMKLQESMMADNRVFESLTQMLDGFKEVKLHEGRSQRLYEHLIDISLDAARVKADIQERMSSQFIFSQSAFYTMMAIMVFLAPRLVHTYDEVVIKTTAAVLFLVGPISNLVGSVPQFAAATAACHTIEVLEQQLEASREKDEADVPPLKTFEEICFDRVTFTYADSQGGASFTVGPMDLVLKRGEAVFIAGGNGSGKSTFLKLLTALYYPSGGVIRVDGEGLSPANYRAYRGLFSAVFAEYHLFRQPYGLEVEAGERLRELLVEMEIENKVHLVNGEFDTLELSSGQKKRLALAVSQLEDRPIYVFDEWAADQDPQFRRKFYEEVLSLLSEQGKTIVAVTHDDRYFGHAERLYKMEEGQFFEVDDV